MASSFSGAPVYNEAPFQEREDYARDLAGHYALDETDCLLKITDWVSGERPRLVEVTDQHSFGRSLGLPSQGWKWNVFEHRLTPVDPSEPNWKAKAAAWRANQRAKVLNHTLPPQQPPRPPPRF